MEKLLGPEAEPEWLEFLHFHTKKLHVGANEVFLREGDEMDGLYTISVGKAKVVQQDGEEQRLIRLVGVGDFLGHRGLGGNSRYPISAVSLVPTDLEFLPLSAFKVISRINAKFVYNLMMFFADELRDSEEKTLQLPVVQRISKSLKMNMDAFGFEPGSSKLSFTISRRDIGTHAGTTYETVIRTLADLSKRGVIGLEGKAIRIEKPEELRRLAAGN